MKREIAFPLATVGVCVINSLVILKEYLPVDVFLRFFFYSTLCLASFLKFRDTCNENKKIYEITVYLGLFMYTAFYAIGNGHNLIRPTVTRHEEFSVAKGNICFRSNRDENIYFRTQYPVEDVKSLAVKDTFNVLVSNQFDVLADKRTVFINFIYRTPEENRKLAERGFVLDYVTRLFVWDPAYIRTKKKNYADAGIDGAC